MNKLKSFNQYIKESTGQSIGDRFEQLVDESDDLGADLKIDNRVVLGEIVDQLREEFPNIYKIESDFMSYYGKDYVNVYIRVFATEKDYNDNDPTEFKECKVSLPDNSDDW